MDCLHCHATNRTGAHFCRRCGTLLGGHCPRCRQERSADADFCDNCGLPLSPRASFGPDRHRLDDPRESARRGQRRPVEAASNLRQYIPQEVRSKLDAVQASGGMVGERRIVTMLFCDVKGSTAMAGQLDPEEWAEMMKGTVEHLVTPVYRYEGTVAQLLGDGILAFFGAPIAHEDDAQRAVLAGLDIVEAIRRLPDARGARARSVVRRAGRDQHRAGRDRSGRVRSPDRVHGHGRRRQYRRPDGTDRRSQARSRSPAPRTG